jgi:cytochrome bd-type quinol oxidase subunit 2
MQLEDFIADDETRWPRISSNLLTALPISILVLLALLYVRGVVRAYLAAGENWKRMDHDVRLVFILIVPLFRAGVTLLMCADRLFYRPHRNDQS